MSKEKTTLGLSIIVKNEAHVIERMLKTVYPILDYYTVVDTGSTDDTKKIIKNFFDDKGIDGQILDRPFDNFERSRNYALEMSKPHTDYGIWIDADEEMIIDSEFKKNDLKKDLYMITTYINSMKYTRNEIWSNDKPYKWIGPVHEYITPDMSIEEQKKLTTDTIKTLSVKVNMDGASWKVGENSDKYKNHASLLEDYINTENRDPRWIFYTAQSYFDASDIPKDRIESEDRLHRAMRYYKERVNIKGGYFEERYYSQYRIGVIYRRLERPWGETFQELLKAYEIEPLRGEPIKMIIDYYQSMTRWDTAYIWTKSAVDMFHNKSPYPKRNGDPQGRLLFLDEKLYTWGVLESHATSCFYTKRIDEAKKCFEKLTHLVKTQPNVFTDDDIKRIGLNAKKIKTL